MKNEINYELIDRAVSSDETAINCIVSIYEPYI